MDALRPRHSVTTSAKSGKRLIIQGMFSSRDALFRLSNQRKDNWADLKAVKQNIPISGNKTCEITFDFFDYVKITPDKVRTRPASSALPLKRRNPFLRHVPVE